MQTIRDLPNIGAVAAAQLAKVGIHTPQELYQVGSMEAFLRIRREVDSGACLSMLCGLEGAVQGVRWHQLPADRKAELKAFFSAL